MTTKLATDPFLFLRKFMRHGVQVASIAPSSRHLALALCHPIDPTRPQIILELGAGTGAVTTVALERMHADSPLLAVEKDADFAHLLRQRCPRAQVLETDATRVKVALQKLAIQHVDVVIGGLPVPSLPYSVNDQILSTVRELAPQGYFSQLTVMPWVYQGFYRRLFHEVAFTPIWRNIPPGGVYHCRHLRDNFANALPRHR